MPATNGFLLTDLDNLALPRGLLNEHIVLGTFSQALSIAFLFLESFSPQTTTQGFTKRCNYVLRQNLPWVSNGYTRLGNLIVKWLQKVGPSLNPGEEQLSLQFLASARRYCVSDASGSALRSDTVLSSSWAQCLSEILPLAISHQSSALQTGLRHILDEVLQATKQSTSFVQQMGATFLPALAEISKYSNLEQIEPCLSVTSAYIRSFCYWLELNLCQNSLHSLQAVLLDASTIAIHPPTVSSECLPADLSATTQRPGISSHSKTQNEGTRPSKRLCLPAKPPDQGLQRTLMARMSLLLGCECGDSLAELRSTVK